MNDTLLIFAAIALFIIFFGLLWFARKRSAKARKWVLVDGSNVMHWHNNTPNIQPVKDVLKLLKSRGFTAIVMFDANAGYELFGKYKNDDAFSKLLGLPEKHIMVVPKGTPADPFLLSAARKQRAQIVTNDRFRDWAVKFPEVQEHGLLITGWYRDGRLHTSLQ